LPVSQDESVPPVQAVTIVSSRRDTETYAGRLTFLISQRKPQRLRSLPKSSPLSTRRNLHPSPTVISILKNQPSFALPSRSSSPIQSTQTNSSLAAHFLILPPRPGAHKQPRFAAPFRPVSVPSIEPCFLCVLPHFPGTPRSKIRDLFPFQNPVLHRAIYAT